MVAYTSDFCLPYLEGSDSPCLNTGTVCDPSSAWCDLITLVEAQLDRIDEIVARTGTAIPLARVSYIPETPTVIGSNIVVPFNIVNVDTDDMVDLDTYQGIIPRRNGVYELLAEVILDTGAQIDPQEGEFFNIQVGGEGVFTTIQGNDDGVGFGHQRTVPTLAPLTNTTYSASAIWNFTSTTPTVRTVGILMANNQVPVISVSLTVFWHSEAV